MNQNSESLNLPKEGFARIPQVLYAVGVGKTKLYQMVKTGSFPAPVKLGARMVAWRVQDVRSWLEQMGTQGVENA